MEAPTEQGRVNLVAAARAVGVTTSTVRYWILAGLLQADYVRGHWMIDVGALHEADKKARVNRRAGKRGRRGTFQPINKG